MALSGTDLLYFRQFQTAVLALTGELFSDDHITAADDPQRMWLDRIATLLPRVESCSIAPQSSFDEHAGRVFHFQVSIPSRDACSVSAPTLIEYQEFQAA